MTGSGAAPLPPLELASRVGSLRRRDPYDEYLAIGRSLRGVITALLGDDWTFEGKRVLDFGCGAGRTLRHFLAEARGAELWGCDVDAASIEWLDRNLCPPLHCFRNDDAPPLPVADGSFDLVWATSVFTHIAAGWSDWVLEMRRVLAPGGLFIASYLGRGAFEALLGEPYVEDEVGMLVLRTWEPRDAGGPWVFHSEWWLRRHWGPALEILEVHKPPAGADGADDGGHSFVLARPRGTAPAREALERVDPGDVRELAALRGEVRLLRLEAEGLASGRLGPPRSRRARLSRSLRESALADRVRPVRDRLRGRRGD